MCINLIDNMMKNIEDSEGSDGELSDIERTGSDIDKSEFLIAS
jgi:hypothetical protein